MSIRYEIIKKKFYGKKSLLFSKNPQFVVKNTTTKANKVKIQVHPKNRIIYFQ